MPSFDLSVIIPTFNRIDALKHLLSSLAIQTVDPASFEVIVIDDGSATPVALHPSQYPFKLTLTRQDNAGPAAARNRGIQLAQAPLTLILNDDASADVDLIATHLDTHGSRNDPIAVLGQFPIAEYLLDSPFMRMLDASDLLFPHRFLTAGELHGPGFFWTCNISIPTQALREVGGFDAATFRHAICEDIEIGFRLAQKGYKVLYNPTAKCSHNHYISPMSFARRAHMQGVNMVKLARIHGWQHLGVKDSETVEQYLIRRKEEYRQLAPCADDLLRRIVAVEQKPQKTGTLSDVNALMDAAWWLNRTHYFAGLIEELERSVIPLPAHPDALRIA